MKSGFPQGVVLITLVLIALFLAAVLFGCDSEVGDGYTLAVYGAVHVYRTETPPVNYPGSDFIAVIGPTDRVQVTQVIEKRDHIAVKIRLSDSRGSPFSRVTGLRLPFALGKFGAYVSNPEASVKPDGGCVPELARVAAPKREYRLSISVG